MKTTLQIGPETFAVEYSFDKRGLIDELWVLDQEGTVVDDPDLIIAAEDLIYEICLQGDAGALE